MVGNDGREKKRYNQAVVLELVRTRGPVSKPDVARAAGLNISVVAEEAEHLIQAGLIREAGTGPSTGGRRPVLLGLVPSARSAVGLNVGTRRITVVVTDLEAVVRKKVQRPSYMSQGPEALTAQLNEILAEALEHLPAGLGRVLGIGLALPAPVLDSKQLAFSPPSYPGWGELHIGASVERGFGLPVLMDNDANAAALGEYLYGTGLGVRNMFYVIAHRGVGGAAIVNGNLYRGARGGAGEIGHSVIDIQGPRCGCGRYGCLEAFAGRAAIARRAARAFKLSGRREVAGREVDEVTAEDVIESALAGDEVALRVLEETGEYLGIGLSNVVNSFDPGLVVVGGSTMKAGELVLEPARRVLRLRALPGITEGVRVVPGALGEDAGAIGAATLVLRELFAVSVPDEEGEVARQARVAG